MTVKEYMREKGFTSVEISDIKWESGYVSRKDRRKYIDRDIHKAYGKRTGCYYVLMPCCVSTRYCYRVYLQFA